MKYAWMISHSINLRLHPPPLPPPPKTLPLLQQNNTVSSFRTSNGDSLGSGRQDESEQTPQFLGESIFCTGVLESHVLMWSSRKPGSATQRRRATLSTQANYSTETLQEHSRTHFSN